MKKLFSVALMACLVMGSACMDPMEDEIKPAVKAPVIKTDGGTAGGDPEGGNPPGGGK